MQFWNWARSVHLGGFGWGDLAELQREGKCPWRRRKGWCYWWCGMQHLQSRCSLNQSLGSIQFKITECLLYANHNARHTVIFCWWVLAVLIKMIQMMMQWLFHCIQMRKYVLVSEIILFRFGGKVFFFFFYELMGIFLLGSLMVHEIDKSGNPGLRCRQPCPQDWVE